MKALLLKPGKFPQLVEIDEGLEPLQEAVGGYIQAVYPWDDPVALIVNEEGKLLHLPFNRVLRDERNRAYDIIQGNALIVGLGEEDFVSLTDRQIEKYYEKLHTPEVMIKIGDQLVVVPA